MTPYEYLMIRNNPENDTSPVIFFFYKLCGGVLNKNEFDVYFIEFLIRISNTSNTKYIEQMVSKINIFVFYKLDEYFKNYI